jgi:hypothetical protein
VGLVARTIMRCEDAVAIFLVLLLKARNFNSNKEVQILLSFPGVFFFFKNNWPLFPHATFHKPE